MEHFEEITQEVDNLARSIYRDRKEDIPFFSITNSVIDKEDFIPELNYRINESRDAFINISSSIKPFIKEYKRLSIGEIEKIRFIFAESNDNLSVENLYKAGFAYSFCNSLKIMVIFLSSIMRLEYIHRQKEKLLIDEDTKIFISNQTESTIMLLTEYLVLNIFKVHFTSKILEIDTLAREIYDNHDFFKHRESDFDELTEEDKNGIRSFVFIALIYLFHIVKFYKITM